jgi:hypothetical protein
MEPLTTTNDLPLDGPTGFRPANRYAGLRPVGAALLALLIAVTLLAGCKKAGEPGAAEGQPGDVSSGGDSSRDSGAGVPNTVVSKSGGNSVSAKMGPPGGTLSLSSGVKVEIPSGALKDGHEVRLSESQMTTAFYNQESERPVGPTFTVSPGMEAPEGRTIRVSIPLAAYPEGWGDVGIAYEYSMGNRVGAEDSEHTRWQYERAKLSGGRAVADLPALNGYRLQFVLTNLEAQ